MDEVIYDQVATWDGRPYRSAALYKQDASAVMRMATQDRRVQVIAEPGDPTWTDAILVGLDTIGQGSIARFYVRIDDVEVRVSEDRIRPKR